MPQERSERGVGYRAYTVRLWLGSRKEVISAEVSVRLSLADDCLRK